jgi:S-(hydroxymethyl)glutathione dehydrogenase / alcohol dehydrogenase
MWPVPAVPQRFPVAVRPRRAADKTIIAVGEMRGEMIEEAMTLTAKTGTCVVTGMGAMTDVDLKLNLFLFTMLQRR